MKLYIQIVKNTWDEMTTYRFNFLMWRVRTVLQLLTVYYLWLAVTPANGEIFGYSQSVILTYVLGASLVGSIVFATRTAEMGENINSGELSQYLIRPLKYFRYWFARDIGDKLFNISFCLGELLLLFFLLRPELFIQHQMPLFVSTVVAIGIAIVMHFFIGCLLSMIAFWNPEMWAPRFVFFTLITFFAGGLFPLDILPLWLQRIFTWFPFGYLQYFPLQIYLGRLSWVEIMQGIGIAVAWSVLLYILLIIAWRRGLKIYSSQGS